MSQRLGDTAIQRPRGTTPVVSVVGRSGSGKTTFVEKLIRELKGRGHRLAAIKHHHHADLEFDAPGKDSYRFAAAGADQVVLAGPTQIVHLKQASSEPSLSEVVSAIHGVDLILTEGWKQANVPQIEVSRIGEECRVPGGESDLVARRERLIALVTDQHYDVPVPQFALGDASGVADLIEELFL